MSASGQFLAIAENAKVAIRDFLALVEQDDASVLLRGLDNLAPQLSMIGYEAGPIFLSGLKGPNARSRVVCAWGLCFLDKINPGSVDPRPAHIKLDSGIGLQ